MRLYWDNNISVNVTGVTECALKMGLCKEGKKISGRIHRGSLSYKVCRN